MSGTSQPFISLCITAYHRAPLFRKLLESVFDQSFTDFEIIVSDNSNNDSVKNIVDEFSKIRNIRYYRNIPVVSATENCARAARHCIGKWIKIMHDDDWFANNTSLQKFADAAQTSGATFIFSACHYVNLEDETRKTSLLPQADLCMLKEDPLNLIYRNVIGHPSVVLHRADGAIEFDPAFRWVVDVDFYVRYLLAHHHNFYYIDEPLINIGEGRTQETNKYFRNASVEIPENFRLLLKYDPSLSQTNPNIFNLVWDLLKRFRIKRMDQIYELGYNGPVPPVTKYILKEQKYIPSIVLKQPKWSQWLMHKSFLRHKPNN